MPRLSVRSPTLTRQRCTPPPGRPGLWRNVGAVALSAVFLGPLAVMVLGSLQRPLQPPPDGLDLWPDPVEWSNYSAVPRFMPLARLLLNSLLLVAVAVPLTVVVTSMAGLANRHGPRPAGSSASRCSCCWCPPPRSGAAGRVPRRICRSGS